MADSLVEYLGSQPIMKILRGLILSPQRPHIRGLAKQYSLSPAGVSDIIRRLVKIGVVKKTRDGNRRGISLKLSSKEAECLRNFFDIYTSVLIEKRAVKFGERAVEKFEWMDEAYKFYREVKRR